MPTDTPLYLNVTQACKRLGISRPTWYRMLEDRRTGLHKIVCRLPGVRRVLIPTAELDAWVKGRKKVIDIAM